jgi:hypothetical protein
MVIDITMETNGQFIQVNTLLNELAILIFSYQLG